MLRGDRKAWQQAARYSSVGIEMAAAMAIGTIGGSWLDETFETEPYLLLFGMLVGMGAAGNAVWRAAKSLQRDQQERRDEEKR